MPRKYVKSVRAEKSAMLPCDEIEDPDFLDLQYRKVVILAMLTSSRQREALSLAFSGQSYREIGQRLGISKQAAHGLLTAAVKNSRENVKKYLLKYW